MSLIDEVEVIPPSKQQKVSHEFVDMHKVSVDIVDMLRILSEGEKSRFDKVFPMLVLLGNKTLSKLVFDGLLKPRPVVLLFPVVLPDWDEVGLHYGWLRLNWPVDMRDMPSIIEEHDEKLLDMQRAFNTYKKRFAKVYTLVGVRACAPTDEASSERFYGMLCEVLTAHTETIEMLDLNVTMPTEVDVLYAFLDVVRSCKNVTTLEMDMTGIVSNYNCTNFIARNVESVVEGMPKLVHLSWTGFHYDRDMYQTEQTHELSLLLYIMPKSVVSLRIAGKISHEMAQKNMFALLDRFGKDTLSNLKVVDLNQYRQDDDSIGGGLHLYARLSDFHSNVERVIMPAEWTGNFKTMGGFSIDSMCLQGAALVDTGKRFTVVVSNTDRVEREAQVQYIMDMIDDGMNVTVEWVGMYA